MVLAATRGNGSEGEDITVNALEVSDIPKPSSTKKAATASRDLAIEVRGELFMRLSVFERYKEQYSNPRNLTAGAIKHKERGTNQAAYTLSFYAYDLINHEPRATSATNSKP